MRSICLQRYSRHQNDTEVQPVPGVSQESKLPHAEAPCQDLNQGLKGVDPCERVPECTQTKLRTIKLYEIEMIEC